MSASSGSTELQGLVTIQDWFLSANNRVEKLVAGSDSKALSAALTLTLDLAW